MEGFSIVTCCYAVSYWWRVAAFVCVVATFWWMLDAFRETHRGAGYTHFDVWVRRVYFVLFVGFAAAAGDLRMTAILARSFYCGVASTAAGAAESIMTLFISLLCAAIIGLASLFASWLGKRRGIGTTRATCLGRPMRYVISLALLASLAAASCISVSSSITGFASTAAVADGSHIAGVTAIGCLLIVIFLITHALRARSKRGKVAPSGAVENTLFMKMMALHFAALILAAYFVNNMILDFQTIALTGVP